VTALTEVIVTGTAAVTVTLPDFEGSWTEVAVTMAVPADVGVNTPVEVIVPPVADQVTPVLYAPVPCTIAMQLAVWVVSMDGGEQATLTEVVVTGTFTVTVAEPDLVTSWVEVAVMVAVPADTGVKTPALLTLPIPEGLTDQLTALLKFPVPNTVGVQVTVPVVRIDAEEQTTATEVTVTGTATVTVALPDLLLPVLSWTEVAVMVAVPADDGVKIPAPLTLPMPEGVTDQLTALL
jgi:hypothetical protein